RSNTIDSGRPSPKLPNAPQRMNSLKDANRPVLPRSNSLRNPPVRSNSLRGGSPQLRGRGGRLMPQRQNTTARAEFLQRQMKNMSLSDDEGYADYLKNFNDNEEYSQVYDFMLGNDKYYNENSDYSRPNLN
ncbi:3474_t:CDS:1, partial [Acaulospora morrowiae]